MVRKLGLLTLGQTPRSDVTPTFRAILGDSLQIMERGGLDGLSQAQLQVFQAQAGEHQLETRLGSGAAIAVSRKALLPRLIQAAEELRRECPVTLLLCSGEFPALAQACPALIQPIHFLRGALTALAGHRLLGLIGPEADLPAAPGQWAPYAPRVICAPASPYQPLAVTVQAGLDLAGRSAEAIFLDDMGFSEEHRTAVAQQVRRPVLCATTLTARVLDELL